MKLHIGSTVRAEGWKTFDINPGPEVDFVGDCRDLSRFPDESIEAIYACHVLEHLPYRRDLGVALKEWLRVLERGGSAMISVPNLNVLCHMFLNPKFSVEDRFFVMQMMFGGQMDAHDFHCVGFDEGILRACLTEAGFADTVRVHGFGLFEDTSVAKFLGVPISLNLTARKPAI